ncbi:Hypothetical protein IALB_2741 [Ignavibacterium album JCM 16511]|uniref:DUF4878 domain-containing protein n=1 Tax=Ignavibacterium album (strain DSM 19864 / JCM 16511 / NBRC 101810 / Mat9-16) TaxID=945713 RepID=I0AN87_IGNAJ|nr:hypothetical protein [Ignavibacterium album]AFH50444.1 Hypothetical protein IALB_2741 [Ignavibacterium album JCM 16511]
MKKFISFLFVIAIIFSGCSVKNNYSTPEYSIEANAKFMNEEDFDGVMSTIHPESPSYSTTEKLVKKIFDTYDLSYKLEKVKLIEKNGNEAKVEFVQLTTKIKGPEFKNNRTYGIHTLKLDGDSWKIFSTEVTDLKFL